MLAALVVLTAYDQLSLVVDSLRGEGASDSSYFLERINPLRIVIAFIPSGLYLLFTRREAMDASGNFYANVMFIHGVVLLAALNSAYLARFGIYTGVFIPLAIPAMINARSASTRMVATVTVLVVSGIYWVMEMGASDALVPFRWIMDRP